MRNFRPFGLTILLLWPKDAGVKWSQAASDNPVQNFNINVTNKSFISSSYIDMSIFRSIGLFVWLLWPKETGC